VAGIIAGRAGGCVAVAVCVGFGWSFSGCTGGFWFCVAAAVGLDASAGLFPCV